MIGSVSDACVNSDCGLGTPLILPSEDSIALVTTCCSSGTSVVDVSDLDARRGHLVELDLVLLTATEGASDGSSRSDAFGKGSELRFELIRGGMETIMGAVCL